MNSIKKISILVEMIFCMQVNAQLKEGFVKYTMKIEGAEDDLMKSMFGNSAINIYFKNDKQVFPL